MNTHELNSIFDDLENMTQNAVKKLEIQAQAAQRSFELEREVRKLQTENSLLKDRNTQLQENQRTWQNRLRGILDKMETV